MAKRTSSAKANKASSKTDPSPGDLAPAAPATGPQLEGPAADDGLTVAQRNAITLLACGRSIKVTAKRVGVHRNTVHRWLRGDPAFRAAYFSWQAEAQESAHARLLSLVDPAVSTIGHAIHQRDLRASLALLKGLSIFTPPAPGPEDPEDCRRWTEMQRVKHEAILMERENRAHKRRSSAATSWDRPYELKKEEEERRSQAALKQPTNPIPASEPKIENPSANPPSQKEVEALMRELDKEDLEDDEDLEDEEDLEEDDDLEDEDLDEEDSDEDD